MELGSVLRSGWKYGMVLLAVSLLIGGSLVWITAISYGQFLFVLGAVLIGGLIAARLHGADSDTESGSVWNAIPNRQYSGRHAESGGLTRGEQEETLREIHDEAEKRNQQSRRR